MELSRRKAIKSMVAASIAGIFFGDSSRAQAREDSQESMINVMLPRSYSPPLYGKKSIDYQYRLKIAIMDYLQDNYSHSHLPFWKCKLKDIDMEKRMLNIIHWIIQSLKKLESNQYKPDPAWILAQIMKESYFYEFALSGDFAAGICQFIPSTAKYKDMITPDNTDLNKSSLHRPDLADQLQRYRNLLGKVGELESQYSQLFVYDREFLYNLLQAKAQGRDFPAAKEYMQVLTEAKDLREEIKQARKNYRQFLLANYKGKNIFDPADRRFFEQFDQRVLYKAPISAMVNMMSNNLRARHGNILTATAGYNAGLSRTYSSKGQYENYGKFPAMQETTTYVSRILINHHEIAKRM